MFILSKHTHPDLQRYTFYLFSTNLKTFLNISLDTSVQEIKSKFKMEIQLQIMLVLKTFSTNCQCQIKIVTNISRRHLSSLRDNSAIWSTYAAIYCLPRMFYLGGIKFFCTLDWKWKDYNKPSWPGVAFLRSKQYWFITGTNTSQFIQNGTYWKSFRIKATLEML